MRTKKDIEKNADNISPAISPGVSPYSARSQKILSISSEQQNEVLIDITIDQKT